MISYLPETPIVAPPGYRRGLLRRDDHPGDACPFIRDQPGFDVIPEQEWETFIDAGSNLSSQVWYISNQGSVGSCAAEGVNNMLALIREQAGLPRVEFNPYAMYHYSSGGSDRGSTLTENLRLARDHGCVPMELWGREKGWRARPSEEALEAAKNYRLDEFYEISNWAEFATALLRGWAVYWGYSGHAIGATDLLNTSQFMLLNSWNRWGRGTEYSTIDHGFGVAERRSIMWSYGCFGFRTPIVEVGIAA